MESTNQPPSHDPMEIAKSVRSTRFGFWTLVGGVAIIIIAMQLSMRASQVGPGSFKSPDISHHKQSALALLMYAEDYDQRMPPASRWMTLSLAYAKAPEVYECPLAKVSSNHAAVPGTSGDTLEYTGDFGHAMNRAIELQSEFAEPERTVLTFCSSNLHWNANDPFVSYVARYSNGFNTSFVDGHSKFSRLLGVPHLKVKP